MELRCRRCHRGAHLTQRDHFPVAEDLALLLPVGVVLHPAQEVVNTESGGSGGCRAQADGGVAVFRDGGAAEVAAGGRRFDPTGLTTAGLPLDPLPVQRCLSLCERSYSVRRTVTILLVVLFFFFKHSSVPQHCRSRL